MVILLLNQIFGFLLRRHQDLVLLLQLFFELLHFYAQGCCLGDVFLRFHGLFFRLSQLLFFQLLFLLGFLDFLVGPSERTLHLVTLLAHVPDLALGQLGLLLGFGQLALHLLFHLGDLIFSLAYGLLVFIQLFFQVMDLVSQHSRNVVFLVRVHFLKDFPLDFSV